MQLNAKYIYFYVSRKTCFLEDYSLSHHSTQWAIDSDTGVL